MGVLRVFYKDKIGEEFVGGSILSRVWLPNYSLCCGWVARFFGQPLRVVIGEIIFNPNSTLQGWPGDLSKTGPASRSQSPIVPLK